MVVGVLRITLRLPARNLKARRQVVRSTVERLRGRFNAAVAEVGELDEPSLAVLAVACVANEGRHVDSQLQAIARAVQEWRLDAELVDIETELIDC